MTNEGQKYDLIAKDFEKDRNKTLREKKYLDLLVSNLPPAAHILDIGCGMAEPIAKYLIEKGFIVTGIDASKELLALCKKKFPQMEWFYGDMRSIQLDEKYDALIAFDSFFHLTIEDQIKMLKRFSSWLRNKGKLLMTTGHEEGEVVNSVMYGHPFSYYSMSLEDYRKQLNLNEFNIILCEEDQLRHRIWIAQKNDAKSKITDVRLEK